MWMWHPSCSTWNQKESPGKGKTQTLRVFKICRNSPFQNLATRVVSAKAYPGLYTPPALGNLSETGSKRWLKVTKEQGQIKCVRVGTQGDKLWPQQFPPCCLLQDNKGWLDHALTSCSVSYKNPNWSFDFDQMLRFRILPTFLPFTVVVTLLLGGIPAFSGSTL